MINHTLNDNFEFSFMAACNRAVKMINRTLNVDFEFSFMGACEQDCTT